MVERNFIFVCKTISGECITTYRSGITSKLMDIGNNFEININNIVGTVIFVRDLLNVRRARVCFLVFRSECMF